MKINLLLSSRTLQFF